MSCIVLNSICEFNHRFFESVERTKINERGNEASSPGSLSNLITM